MTFAGIEERRSEYPVAVSCRAPGVSPSGSYARARRAPRAAAGRREALAARIREAHAETKGRYGRPPADRRAERAGTACRANTVARVMKDRGIWATSAKRFVRTTDSAEPNAARDAGIPYVPTLAGGLSRALVVALFSRQIVGWAMAAAMTSRRVVGVLDLAVRRPRDLRHP